MITAHAVSVVTIPLPWGPIYRYITAHAVNVVIIPTYEAPERHDPAHAVNVVIMSFGLSRCTR